MRRRCTLHITLALIGTLAVTGCSKKEERHVYTNKQDCLDDWNNDPQNCRAAYRNNWRRPGNRNDNLGFRLVLAPRSTEDVRPFP